MKRVLQMWLLALAVLVGVSADARPAAQEGSPRSHGEMSSRLSRHGSFGRINIQGGKKHFPEGAEVSVERKRPDDVKRKIHQGWSKRKRSGKNAASPNILASYDISIRHGGKKWQPDAGDLVRVTVDLDEPVSVTATSSLGVVHLSDDGTVEELDPSRYGFTYNADKTAVTAFWFSATGFSVYSIIDNSGDLKTPRRFYHFYDHPSAIDGSNAVQTFPYRYTDRSNDVMNVQIVKDGNWLVEPPIPRDLVDVNSNLVSSFEGWYVVHTNARPVGAAESKLDSTTTPFEFVWPVGVTDHRLSFTNAIAFAEAETNDTDYWVVPLYEHSRFVQFYESAEEDMQSGSNPIRIVGRRLVALNDETHSMHVRVSDVSAPLRNSLGEYFTGWEYHRTKGGARTPIYTYSSQGVAQEAFLEVDDALFEANRTETNDGNTIPLWPLYVEAHFLSFSPALPKGSGATYVGSLFVRSDSDVRSAEISARPGYAFGGWWMGTDLNTLDDDPDNDDIPNVVYGQQVSDASGNLIANLSSLTNHLGQTVASTDANGKITLHADVMLYAKWIPLPNATYRVIIWQQKVTDPKNAAEADKTYDYVTHYTSDLISSGQGVTEAMLRSFSGTNSLKSHVSGLNVLSADALKDRTEVTTTGVSFTGFETTARWAVKNTDGGHIKSDNSTVVNVYFDRKLITLQFYVPQVTYTYTQATSNNGTQYGTDNGTDYYQIYYKSSGSNRGWYKDQNYSTAYRGTRYTRSESTTLAIDNSRTMTGLYGQTLAANGYTWDMEYWWYDKMEGSSGTRTRTTFLDAFLPTSGGDETYYGSDTSSTSTTINFYKEALDGSWILANSVPSTSGGFNISDKYNGFTAYQYRKNNTGDWTGVGTYNESTGYYGNQVSSYTTLDIRFARNEYEFNFRDSDTGEDVFTTNMLFEASLAGLDLPPTSALIDWKGRDQEHYTFAGWYEDASCTKAFNFASGVMSAAPKTVYAKWDPVKFKVIIDPNGGQLEGDDSTWFYVDYNETVKEYTPTREYRLDMSGEYYYSYHPWDPLGDKHVTPTNSPDFIQHISRRAYYTKNVDEATDTFNRYAYERNAYRFMGWYEVLPDGTVDSAPFAFGTRHNRSLTIRAIWQRTGLYILKYESVDPSGERPTEVWFDPAEGEHGGYIDDGVTTLSKDPTNYDSDEYVWEGWQVVDPRQNNLPLTNIRSPGDVYIVHSSHADSENVIHMRAVYARRASGTSMHIPNVVDLVLDSNDDAGLASGFAPDPSLNGVGTYTDGTVGGMSGLGQGIWFGGQQNNFSVNLADYTSAFTHSEGFLLLGWDTNRVSSTMIPAYYANETIGVDKSAVGENLLYAVWEPQIYILFTNKTGVALNDITLSIPSWSQGEVFRVNSVEDTYHRQAFTAFHDGRATFSMAKDESVCLVLPDGADKFFTVSGTNTWSVGTKLTATRGAVEYLDENNAPAVDGAMASTAFPSEEFVVTGTMRVNENPVMVSFEKFEYPTEINVPVRYFLHFTNTADGVVQEITSDDGFWRELNGLDRVTNITVRAADGDVDLSVRLRASVTESVHEFLADIRPGTDRKLRENFKSTTIGIGSASAPASAFPGSEYRSITKHETSGGSYLRFLRGELEWSRYSYVWNTYDDAAVYVVFYRREPVHVTVAKKVVGTASDSAKAFSFTADIAEHSRTVQYTVTSKFTRTRTETRTRNNWWSQDWTTLTPTPWEDIEMQPNGLSTTNAATIVSNREDRDLFPARPPESVNLKDTERHPFTIYFNASQDSTTRNTAGQANVTSWDGGTFSTTQTRTVTTNWTEETTYTVIYQYETATITEAADEAFDLHAIAGDSSNPSVNHNGTPNLNARTYTISSLAETGRTNFYTYQPLDTAIFTNWRRTAPVTVTKTVEGAKAEDRDDTFDFAVTLADGEELNEAFLEAHPMPAGVSYGPARKIFTFSLKDTVANGAANGSKTLTLPLGAGYVVEEISPGAKYVATAPANASGTVPSAGVTVPFVNTRKVELGIAMNNLTLEFNGALQYGYDISTVEGTGSDITETAYTVTGLKSGHVLTVQHHLPAQGTDVGSYMGQFGNARITVARAADSADVTGEYLVTATPGSLTIDTAKLDVTITGNSETVTYNGEEQAVEGYTYVIIRKSDNARIGDDEVHPVIEPAYSKAKGTSAGTYYMTLLDGTAVSFVKGPGYEIAPADIHIVNGSLTISPAPVTVTADDKSKLPGFADPTLTATVTGLIGSDTVSYSLARAAGEAVGTYAITASGAADQGNYTVTYVPGTFSIKALTLIQRATGEGLPVTVPVSSSLLASLGIANPEDATSEVVDDFLNQMDPNGLRRWENLRTGTEPSQLLLSTSAAGTSQISAQMVADPGTVVDLGYTMLRELRKEQSGTWVRVAGPAAAGNPSFPIELEDEGGNSVDASGLYRVVTLLVPNQNTTITNELPSTNIIGVLEINNAVSNTITAVPWKQLASDPAAASDVTVSNLVAALNLSAGDAVYTLDAEQRGYRMWNRQADGIWEPVTTVRTADDGSSLVLQAGSADVTRLPRGGAVWVKRAATAKPYFLVGQYDDGEVTMQVPGKTDVGAGLALIAIPSFKPVYLNKPDDYDGTQAYIDWSKFPVGTKDRIRVPVDGVQVEIECRNGVWGTPDYAYVYNEKKKKMVWSSVFKSYDQPIKAGTGFFYFRMESSGFTFTWK